MTRAERDIVIERRWITHRAAQITGREYLTHRARILAALHARRTYGEPET